MAKSKRIQNIGGSDKQNYGTSLQLTTPASSGIQLIVNSQQQCQNGLSVCCPLNGYQCGMRYPPHSQAPSSAGQVGRTDFGEYPWLAAIISSTNSFVCTGALIDHQHVITVAHKLNFTNNGFSTPSITVTLGLWDGNTEYGIIPPTSYQVQRIFIHPQYNSLNLRNDIAVIRLVQNVNLGATPTVGTVCLPSLAVTMTLRCYVAGYGASNVFGSSSATQREVDLQLVDPNICQNQLRQTKLGQGYSLDSFSFICAGGEQGKDACTGDGGSPLVCHIANQWYVLGLVAYGVGCGQQNVPGVYVNVASYVNWIQQSTASR